MVRPSPDRRKPGKSGSKIDRDTSKKKVAQSKVSQKQAMAAKSFEKRQKELSQELVAIKKIKAVIDAMIKKQGEDQKLDQRFLNQIIGKVKALKNFEKQINFDQKSFSTVVDAPKTYSVAVVDARKAPKVSSIKTYGDLSVLLAVAIVILNRLLKLKVKKSA